MFYAQYISPINAVQIKCFHALQLFSSIFANQLLKILEMQNLLDRLKKNNKKKETPHKELFFTPSLETHFILLSGEHPRHGKPMHWHHQLLTPMSTCSPEQSQQGEARSSYCSSRYCPSVLRGVTSPSPSC